jgi:hypothetical protein
MAATGEKYTQAHRALINAARREVLPMSGRVILPRIAARYADNPAEPVRVFVEISGIFDLEMDEPEVAEYLAADEDGRDVIMMNFVSERITDWAEDNGELMIDTQLSTRTSRRTPTPGTRLTIWASVPISTSGSVTGSPMTNSSRWTTTGCTDC